ncbi:MAG: diguanylate cyclase [Chloroflexaceae bacterium]|nr:diguanylate cyclase [Chloroflexaceae bacterium]
MMGRNVLPTILHPDDLVHAINHRTVLAQTPDETVSHFEYRVRHKDGTWRWLQSREVVFMRTTEGQPQQILGVAHDITEQKLNEEALRASEHRLLQSNEELRQRNRDIWLLNEMGGLLQACSDINEAYRVIASSAEKLFEGQAGALYLHQDTANRYTIVANWGELALIVPSFNGCSCPSIFEQQTCSPCQAERTPCQHLQGQAGESILCIPLVVWGKTLGILHLHNHTFATSEHRKRWQQLADSVAHHVSLALTSLTLREQLKQQAIRDALTGLYNRRYLDETLPRELQRAARHNQSVTVMMIDVDHFKYFNDTYGHDMGDALLRTVGAFLETHTRSDDIVCRYGGEEFMLVLPGAAMEPAHLRAEELRVGLQSMNIEHKGHLLDAMTVSIGVATFPDHGTFADALIKSADEALYRAKHSGRNRVALFGAG